MCYDGASNQNGFRVGNPLFSTEGAHALVSIKLDFEVTNNVVSKLVSLDYKLQQK